MMPRPLVRSLLYPLHERLRRRTTLPHYRRMRRNDRLGVEALQELHDEMLLAHLRRSALAVPFYRDQALGGIESVADLARFPILDKPAVRAAGESLVAESWREKVFCLETGGSSGEPLRFYTERERESSQLACKLRARAWWGLNPGHRETDFWGSPIETVKGGRIRSVVSRALGFQLLSAFALNDEVMSSFAEALSQGHCDFVYGYPSVLARYARFARRNGIDLGRLGIRLVICTAEVLLPADRQLIGEAFGCPVANEYGCRDGGLVAHECPAGGFHLMHDAVHVEILDEDLQPVARGGEGEVVLTNLLAEGSPLIRYRLGDHARLSLSPCECGLPHPCLESVSGRVTDSLLRSDGTRVHGLALIYVLREFPGVARFRCRQKQRTRVLVEVVRAEGFDTGAVERGIVDRVRRVLGEDIEVEMSFCEDLEPLPSGKHRFIICDLGSDGEEEVGGVSKPDPGSP